MGDFVIREWHLEPYDGDQAPLHVHHGGEEAFVCIGGDLEVVVGDAREPVPPGRFVLIPRGIVHTFATRKGAQVVAIMSPEIADLIDGLHAAVSDADRAAAWEKSHSALA